MFEGLLEDYHREEIKGDIIVDEDDYAVICEKRIGKSKRTDVLENKNR